MRFEQAPLETAYLHDTAVENLFIGHYLSQLSGDSVKVYLYGTMLSQLGKDFAQALSGDQIAQSLGLAPGALQIALEELRTKGLLREQQGSWQITPLKDRYFQKTLEEKGLPVTLEVQDRTLWGQADAPERKQEAVAQKAADSQAPQQQTAQEVEQKKARRAAYDRLLNNSAITDMIQQIQMLTGRFLLAEEQQAISGWLEDYNIAPDMVVRAYEYAVKQRDVDNYRYVGKVLLAWASQGLGTVDQVEDYLSLHDQRRTIYRRIMRALGFTRNVTEEEARLIDGWIDEENLSMQAILEACGKTAGISNPNIKYVNAVLRNQREESTKTEGKAVSRRVVMNYYAKLRQEAEETAERHRQQVYSRLPEIQQLDQKLAQAGGDLAVAMFTGASNAQSLRASMERMEQQRAAILTENNIPIDYMNRRYRCAKCRDTGTLDEGDMCSCYLERAKEAEMWANETEH